MKTRMMMSFALVALATMVFAEAWQIGGIGIAIGSRRTTKEPLRVARVFPGSPAERAGIKTNWFLISVDGTNVVSMSSTRCMSSVSGPEGTVVTVELADPMMRQTNKFTIRRANIRMPDDMFKPFVRPPDRLLIAR